MVVGVGAGLVVAIVFAAAAVEAASVAASVVVGELDSASFVAAAV